MRTEATEGALERLAKWRTFFAGWQLGTRPIGDPECDAVRDHRELSIMLRAEVSALVGLLIDKGVFTAEEWIGALDTEAEQLAADYSERFPGIKATDAGLAFDVAESPKTLRRMNFRP